MPNAGPNTKGYSPANLVTLTWSTWSEAASQAALSRMLGGIHIRPSNEDGMVVGRQVGRRVFAKYSKLVSGITDRKSTRLNSSHVLRSRMPSSA